VQSLRVKHARGLNAVEELFNISDWEMTTFLARDDIMWDKLRNLAKFLDRIAMLKTGPMPLQNLYFNALSSSIVQTETRLKNRLTACNKGAMIEEQVNSKGLEGHKPDNPLPLVLEDGIGQYTFDFGV